VPAVFPTLQKHTSRMVYTPPLQLRESVSPNGILPCSHAETYNWANWQASSSCPRELKKFQCSTNANAVGNDRRVGSAAPSQLRESWEIQVSARMIAANLVTLKRNDLAALRTGHAANNCRSWSQYFTV
jgi:hypothetical protein